MARAISLLLCLTLAACSSTNGHVIYVPAPTDPDTHVVGYQVVPRFTGIEVTLGIPALSPVPVIGPALAEAIKLKAGGYDTIIIPIIQEDQYRHEARIAAARARWTSYPPRVR